MSHIINNIYMVQTTFKNWTVMNHKIKIYNSPKVGLVISVLSDSAESSCYKGLRGKFYEVTPYGPLDLRAKQSASR